MATGLREGKLWIQTCYTPLKNWPCVTSRSCGGVGKYGHCLLVPSLPRSYLLFSHTRGFVWGCQNTSVWQWAVYASSFSVHILFVCLFACCFCFFPTSQLFCRLTLFCMEVRNQKYVFYGQSNNRIDHLLLSTHQGMNNKLIPFSFVWFGLVSFYGTSTIVGYLIPNSFLNILTVLFQTIQLRLNTVSM